MSASVILGPPNLTTIVFDQELVPAGLAAAQWSGRLNDTMQGSDIANAAGNTVVWQSEDTTPDAGPNVVSYDDAVADLVSRFNGLPAPSFTDFPVDVA